MLQLYLENRGYMKFLLKHSDGIQNILLKVQFHLKISFLMKHYTTYLMNSAGSHKNTRGYTV